MDKTVEYADGGPVKMKKKSKKNKNMNNDLQPVGDRNSNIETDGDCLKKNKGDKHMEKKRKSESKEQTEKKRKSESKEHTEKKRKSEAKEDGETDGDHSMKKKKKKRKSESKEDGDEDQQDKGNLVNEDQQHKGNLEMKNKKRKRRYSSEKEELQENQLDQNAGSDVGKDFDPKHEKKKRDVVEGTRISMKDCSEDMFKKVDKKKKKKKVDSQSLDTEINRIVTEESTLKTRDTEDKSMEKQKAKVKGHRVKNKEIESVENSTEKPKAKSKSKKVSFSGHVEVFPTSDTEPEKQTTNGDGLVRGKRFTPEEDEMVKQAVLDYITAKGLGDEGLKMVLNCKSHPGMKKCWQEIGLCIPYRPHTAIYYRAHILFERAQTRSWTSEEIELLKEFHGKYGNDWKKIADELGKHRFHVKDTWRRIKLENLKGGKWSQEEYQNLYDLVNLDLLMKINGEEKKKSKHGMLRDNIPWTAISEKLSTRSDSTCCAKWYDQLTSSLVAEKKWSDADDYRMIGALYEMDAACVEDVDWDDVLEHRPGEICLKRWNQMVKHIDDYRSKTFGEQVDVLAKRYCPDLAETREVWDTKTVVP